jgi:hypothetical protein
MSAINAFVAVPMPFKVGLAGAILAVGAALYFSDRRRSGTFVNGYRRGRTMPLTFALLGVMLALLFGQVHAREAGLSTLTHFGLALLAFLMATWFSVIWQRIYLAELRGGEFHHVFDLAHLAHVGAVVGDLHTQRGDLGLGAFGVTKAVEHDVGALAGQGLGNAQADAAGGARDEGGFVLEHR